MAEKKAVATYDSIMRDLKAQHFAPIYILMGEESYFIDKIADFIAEHVLSPEEQAFNQSIVFGADVTVAQICDLARAYPMMASHRVVIVKEAQAIRSWEAMEKYVDSPAPTTILVVCHKNGTIDRRKKFVAKVEQVGVVFESKKKRDYELPAFVEGYLKTKGATIESKAAAMVADHIGSDLSRLTSELDKLLISLPAQDRRITPETVECQIGISKEFNVFELRNAIIARDVFKANQIVNYFDKNPKAGSLYSFLPMLFGYFQNLMVAHYCPAKNNDKALAEFLDLKSVWGVKDYLAGLRNYNATKTLRIISKIREIDAKSKGLDNLNTGAGDLMRELIFFILH